jgi:hypothetical protein
MRGLGCFSFAGSCSSSKCSSDVVLGSGEGLSQEPPQILGGDHMDEPGGDGCRSSASSTQDAQSFPSCKTVDDCVGGMADLAALVLGWRVKFRRVSWRSLTVVGGLPSMNGVRTWTKLWSPIVGLVAFPQHHPKP